MRIFFVFNVLCLALGICFAFTLDELDILNIDDETARQSDLQNQIGPIFGITFVASLLNSLLFNQLVSISTPSTTSTSTTTTSTTTASTTTATTSTTTASTTTTATTTSTSTTTANPNTPSCRCGVKNTRIIGGSDVSPINKYPWVVSIAVPGFRHWCGGTLVASKYVVTAAHCMWADEAQTQPRPVADITITIGEHDLSQTGETTIPEKKLAVTSYVNHEDYGNPGSYSNDITVIELAEELDLTVYIPACLAQTGDTTAFDGKTAQAYGWGANVADASGYPDILQEVSVPVVTKTQCATDVTNVEDGMICAGGVAGEDSCSGDSGGPLTYESGDQHILIGETSFGPLPCAQANKYGVYGRISYFRTWIESKMTSPTFCSSGPNADTTNRRRKNKNKQKRRKNKRKNAQRKKDSRN